MKWKKLPSWVKGLIIGIGIDVIGSVLFPTLVFFGFFGSWLNFDQYSSMGFVTIVMENYILSWIIVLTISVLIGLLFNLKQKKQKKKKILTTFAIFLACILIVEIFVFGYSWKNSGTFQTWGTLQDCPGLKKIETKDSCYFNFAVENKDSSLCYKLSENKFSSANTYNTQYCLAIVNRDASYCNKSSDEDERDNCFEGVSVDLLNRSLCNYITNPERKDHCFRAFDEFVSVNEIKIEK